MKMELDQVIMGNTLRTYLVSLLIILGGIILVQLLKIIFKNKLNTFLRKKGRFKPDYFFSLINKRFSPLLYILFTYIAFQRLSLNHTLARTVYHVLFALAVFFSALFLQDFLISLLKSCWRKKKDEEENLFQLINIFIKMLIWILALIFVLDNIGIKLTGLLTGLGIGGIAVAFAAQAVLSDIFSYFTIILDRPFDIGDYIVVGSDSGTVEHIGLKTTRIRSRGGEELIFPNNDITDSRINNYKRMERRRVDFSFGVVYDTDLNELKKIPDIVERIINNYDAALFSRAHFSKFGNFSLIIDVVYYILDSDYTVYMDTHQQINLELKKEMEKRNIEFALPTQTLLVENKGKE